MYFLLKSVPTYGQENPRNSIPLKPSFQPFSCPCTNEKNNEPHLGSFGTSGRWKPPVPRSSQGWTKGVQGLLTNTQVMQCFLLVNARICFTSPV